MQQTENTPDSQSGKMSPELSAVTREPTSKPSSKSSARSKNPEFMYLNLRERETSSNGSPLDASWETATALPGVSMTLNTGEYPSVERESTLSQILEVNAPEKYFLSPKAALGILRRAERRGKELPPMLKEALEEVIALSIASKETPLTDRTPPDATDQIGERERELHPEHG